MNKIENVNYDSAADQSFEDRSSFEEIREDNKIKYYKFNILVRNKPALTGTFSREDLELIYRLYSSEGSNLSQRDVSRYFPLYTIQEFKKIIRAFNITKSVSPFPPHIIEEKTESELILLQRQYLENNFLKKYEQEKSSIFKKKYYDTLKDYSDLKSNVSNFSELISNISVNLTINPRKPEFNSGKVLLVYLSDMHIGAEVSAYALYPNTFNKEVATQRMNLTFDECYRLAYNYGANEIIVVNNGDSLDGMNGQTTRGGHMLPQNMTNKDQFKNYFSIMMDLFKNLSECGQFAKVSYVCVGTSNHDGSYGYIANKALEAGLSYLNSEIEVTVIDKIMGHFSIGNHTFILHHGKDENTMFKNLPLFLNDKTENYINQYIDFNKITGNIHFVKGDLHQSSTSYGYKFRYKNVGSFFGSSEWVQNNFVSNKPCVDFDILDGDKILETRLIF